MDSGGSGRMNQVMIFPNGWLVTHNQGCGKKYGPHLDAKGVH